eukprot:scaffold93054_cov23-Tisochrysis_lutea.AAC.1
MVREGKSGKSTSSDTGELSTSGIFLMVFSPKHAKAASPTLQCLLLAKVNALELHQSMHAPPKNYLCSPTHVPHNADVAVNVLPPSLRAQISDISAVQKYWRPRKHLWLKRWPSVSCLCEHARQ